MSCSYRFRSEVIPIVRYLLGKIHAHRAVMSRASFRACRSCVVVGARRVRVHLKRVRAGCELYTNDKNEGH